MRPPTPDRWTSARVVVVVAHPDDEVLGCGALLARLRDVTVIHVTDGAPRDGADAARHGFADPAAYAAARRGEALAALALAGVPAERVLCLGIPDQGVPAAMALVARRLTPLLDGADVVLTHVFEGGHGDHDGVAYATNAAARRCAERPDCWEMPFYHGDAGGWVRGRFLPRDPPADEHAIVLTRSEQDLKARMMAAHASQRATLDSFACDVERVRPVRPTDFAQRPHDGPLLYERHGWSLTWPQWQAHVAAAEAALADAP